MSDILPDGRQMWIRSFYGFAPEEAGYVGWTKEAGQQRALRELNDGDLMLIYGASSGNTKKEIRSHVLGFVEIESRPIRDHEKAAPTELKYKADNGYENRWTFGIPIRRAWRALDKLQISRIAPKSYDRDAGQGIGVWGKALTEEEIANALKIKVREINVFGEPPIRETEENTIPLGQVFMPSKAFKHSSGERTSNYEDGDTYLYLAIFKGDGHALLGRKKAFGDKSVILKIGVSNDTNRRCEELNSGIPPAAVGRWAIEMTSKYSSHEGAEKAEAAYKSSVTAKLESLGGEFFWGTFADAQSLYCSIPGVSRF